MLLETGLSKNLDRLQALEWIFWMVGGYGFGFGVLPRVTIGCFSISARLRLLIMLVSLLVVLVSLSANSLFNVLLLLMASRRESIASRA